MYHIIEAMTRWIAPILSFTAEEMWQYLPKKTGQEREESVFLSSWYDFKAMWPVKIISEMTFWKSMIKIREVVNKTLEGLRAENKLKGGLEAEVIIYADNHWFSEIAKLEDELRFVLITSKAVVLPIAQAPEAVLAIMTDIPGIHVEAHASTQPKCVRCWHHREDVNTNADYPGLCGRCITNVSTATGEERKYA
jgi:isoleucyl-tRNA synthetase